MKRDVSGAEEFLNKAKFDEGAVNANLEKFAKTLREAIEKFLIFLGLFILA